MSQLRFQNFIVLFSHTGETVVHTLLHEASRSFGPLTLPKKQSGTLITFLQLSS